jgi:hypothetical protein
MKPKVLFVYDLENEHLWKDGLYAAVELLKQDFEIEKQNLHGSPFALSYPQEKGIKFVLGWGGFGSTVDRALRNQITYNNAGIANGLCLGGYALPEKGLTLNYNVLFYETEWSMDWLKSGPIQAFPQHQTRFIHAFGVNTDVYFAKESLTCPREKIWDYITVGAFALWKRQHLLTRKEGMKLAVGQIQKNNLSESIDIIGDLLLGNCAVSDMVTPEELAKLYRISKTCYIPADVLGGGERAVLEARACDIDVEVEQDNPKLIELTQSPIWDQHYYYNQLKEGILSCVS